MKAKRKLLLRAVPPAALALGAAAIAVGGSGPATALADGVCPTGVVTTAAPTQDAQIWDVEGKIASYDTAARTITANGMTFRIPQTLKVKTDNLDQAVGNIEFAGAGSLTDSAFEAQKSIVGGSAIASGTIVSTPVGTAGEVCVTFEATSVYVEFAEHGVVGPLLSVDKANNTFTVGGTTIKMSDDPRFPKHLADLAGNQLSIDQLATQTGVLVDAVGYYDEAGATLRGTVVEADTLTPQPLTDTVMVSQAQWKSQELRVRGAVSRLPDGQFAPTVALHSGGSDGTTCTGVALSTTVLDTADGDGAFEFRLRSTTNPGTICVKSAGGGVQTRAVTTG